MRQLIFGTQKRRMCQQLQGIGGVCGAADNSGMPAMLHKEMQVQLSFDRLFGGEVS